MKRDVKSLRAEYKGVPRSWDANHPIHKIRTMIAARMGRRPNLNLQSGRSYRLRWLNTQLTPEEVEIIRDRVIEMGGHDAYLTPGSIGSYDNLTVIAHKTPTKSTGVYRTRSRTRNRPSSTPIPPPAE